MAIAGQNQVLLLIKASSQKAKEKQIENGFEKINYKTVNAKVVKKNLKIQEEGQNISVSEMIAKAKEKATARPSLFTRTEGLLPVGTRVFHINFGVGKIVGINKNNGQSSYVVNFTKAGEKILDISTSGLKTF